MKKFLIGIVFSLMAVSGSAQFTQGTTGLLEMPTADMQKDKTFMLGGRVSASHGDTAALEL